MARKGRLSPGQLHGRWLTGPQLNPEQVDLENDRILIPRNSDGIIGETVTPQAFSGAFVNPGPPVPPEPPPPDTDLHFGSLDLCGCGGIPMDVEPGSLITGTGASDFVIDADGMLAPSGTKYALKTWSQATYDLTLADATEWHVVIDTGVAYYRGEETDTATVNQLIKITSLRSRPITIRGRDGSIWNPRAQLWRISCPSAGTGRCLITSETVSSATDAYGNPKYDGLSMMGSLTINVPTSPDVEVPLDIEYVAFYNNVDEAGHANMVGTSNTTGGYGWNVTHCSFEWGDAVSTANCKYGVVVRGGDCSYNWARHMLNSWTGGHPNGTYETTFTNNTSFNCLSDDLQTSGAGNITEENNLDFDPWCAPSAHADSWQHLVPAGVVCSGLRSINCITVLNTITGMSSGKQGKFASNNTLAINGLEITNPIVLDGAPNGIRYTKVVDGVVTGAMVLRPYGVSAAFIADSNIDFTGSTSGTVERCVANGFTLPVGFTSTNNVELDTLAEVLVAFPNFPNSADPGLTNRADIITACTPADVGTGSGGVRISAGVFAGPLDNNGDYQ